MNIPTAQVYTKTSFWKKRLGFRRFWVREPRYSETILAEMCYLYRRMRLRAAVRRRQENHESYFGGGDLKRPEAAQHTYTYKSPFRTPPEKNKKLRIPELAFYLLKLENRLGVVGLGPVV